MMTNIIFFLLFISFCVAAIGATLSLILGFQLYTAFGLFCMGATAYAMNSFNKYLY